MPGKAAGMRVDLCGNGIGDQVDQRRGKVQIDGSVEIVFVFCRDAPGGGDGFKVGQLTAIDAATWSFRKHTIVAVHLICTLGSPGMLESNGDALHLYRINLNIKRMSIMTQKLIYLQCFSEQGSNKHLILVPLYGCKSYTVKI